MQTTVDDTQLKSLIKEVFIEVLSERPELIRNALEDALEDFALARAIEEGDGSGNVSRDEVFVLLRGAS
jgi:hypothetical protein